MRIVGSGRFKDRADISAALMRLGFDFYGCHRLHARCLSANIPAIRLFEKAGFTREGVLRRHMMTRDGLMDVLLFGMLKEEFRQRYD